MAKLIDLTGATVTVPAGWTASAGYGDYDVFGTFSILNTEYTDIEFYCLNIGYKYNGVSYSGAADVINFEGDSDTPNVFPSDSFVVKFDEVYDGESLIQWFLDNNATIEGGVWEEEDIPRIIYNNQVIAELGDSEVTILCAGKKMLSDIVIVNPVMEEEGTKVNTFEIWNISSNDLSNSYQYEEDMTWEEFINSEYNTGSFSLYGTNNNIVGKMGTYLYKDNNASASSSDYVYKTDVINQSRYYTLSSSGGGAN